MDKRSDAQIIEIFHLLLVQVLTVHKSDWFILKGGANLRYYFGSVRYSNDIDLDFSNKPGWNVEKIVDSALAGNALKVLLAKEGLTITQSTKPKQTETTRRWKLGLARQYAINEVVRTKIEFSYRDMNREDVLFETIPNQVVAAYALRPATLSHYGKTAALNQKIAALALRSETKARDIFDLELLFRLRRASGDSLSIDVSRAAQAMQNALAVGYSSFRSEVIPFLDPEIAVLYEGEDSWMMMRTSVVDEINALLAGLGSEDDHEGH